MNILIWNVYKGQKKSHFERELVQFGQGKDFIFLQEAIDDSVMPTLLQKHFPHYQWNMAHSFRYLRRHPTGVAMGSHHASIKISQHISRDRELFFLTPKSTLFVEFEVEGVRVLFVCTHLLNFVTTHVFSKSLYEIIEKIHSFQGPIVIAGDFNTWNYKRLLILKNIMKEISLEHVDFDSDGRIFKLDHLFVRGFDVIHSHIHTEVKGSDHFPLEARLKLK